MSIDHHAIFKIFKLSFYGNDKKLPKIIKKSSSFKKIAILMVKMAKKMPETIDEICLDPQKVYIENVAIHGPTFMPTHRIVRNVSDVMDCTVMYCNVLHCNVLHCNVLHCNVLYCNVLHCNVLHCNVLHCNVL